MSEPEEPPTLAEDLAIDEYEDLRKAADREASGDAPAVQGIEDAEPSAMVPPDEPPELAEAEVGGYGQTPKHVEDRETDEQVAREREVAAGLDARPSEDTI